MYVVVGAAVVPHKLPTILPMPTPMGIPANVSAALTSAVFVPSPPNLFAEDPAAQDSARRDRFPPSAFEVVAAGASASVNPFAERELNPYAPPLSANVRVRQGQAL